MKKLMLCILLSSCLGACGVKPSQLDGGKEHPRTYPDISTDPAPYIPSTTSTR